MHRRNCPTIEKTPYISLDADEEAPQSLKLSVENRHKTQMFREDGTTT